MNTELISFFDQVARKVRTEVGTAPSAPGSGPPAENGSLFSLGHNAKKFGFFRLLSKRFPYSIYYDFVDIDIVVFGVFGDRQNPELIEASLRQRDPPKPSSDE